MTVSQDYQLRKTVKEAGGEYKVVKNNLAQIAAEGLSSAPLFDKVAGMTSSPTQRVTLLLWLRR